ncbi:MAG: hypothetical protein ACI8RZ_003171 [Myxococcota bacterium]|jgi:hypothetical protein
MPGVSLLLLVRLLHATEPAPVLIDRVVVVVDDRIVTASDLALEEDLSMRIPSPILALALRTPTDALIDRALIRGLASEVGVYQPSTADVRQRLTAIRSTFSGPEEWADFLNEHGLTEDDLAGRLFSQMVVERYVRRNIELASQANQESREEYLARYTEWITAHRAVSQIRTVDPRSGSTE